MTQIGMDRWHAAVGMLTDLLGTNKNKQAWLLLDFVMEDQR